MSIQSSDLVFRTTDLTKWGAGKSGNLEAVDVDNNFWALFQALNDAIENPIQPVQITGFVVSNNVLTVTMSDGTSYGPLPLPVNSLNFIEDGWTADTDFHTGDMFVGPDDILYFVARPFTSGDDFDADVSDGSGKVLKPITVTGGGGGGGASNEVEFHFNVPGPITGTGAGDFQNIASFASPKNWQITDFDNSYARIVNTPVAGHIYLPVYRGVDMIGRVDLNSSPPSFSLESGFEFPISVDAGQVVSLGAPLNTSDDNAPTGETASGLVGVISGEVVTEEGSE